MHIFEIGKKAFFTLSEVISRPVLDGDFGPSNELLLVSCDNHGLDLRLPYCTGVEVHVPQKNVQKQHKKRLKEGKMCQGK